MNIETNINLSLRKEMKSDEIFCFAKECTPSIIDSQYRRKYLKAENDSRFVMQNEDSLKAK